MPSRTVPRDSHGRRARSPWHWPGTGHCGASLPGWHWHCGAGYKCNTAVPSKFGTVCNVARLVLNA